MAVFEYIAKDAGGNKFSGVYTDIETVKELRQELSKLGYALVKAHRGKKAAGKRTSINKAEVVAFAFEFAGMYSAGLSIIRCLETFELQTENLAFKEVVADVRQQVETGLTLREAFEKYSDIFSNFFLGMVEAGEAGGKLGETLLMAAQYLEKQSELKSKIKAAFAYPITVGVMCILIVSALVIFVVPVFQKLYSQLHVTLPGPTLFLIFLSEAARRYWWIIIPSVVLIPFFAGYFSKIPAVKARLDTMKLRLPIFGKLNRMIVASRFTRTLAMMLSAGVGIVEALDLSKQVVNNYAVDKMTVDLQEKIMTGSSLAEPMSQYDIFPPMLYQLAGAGEEAGVLPEMLQKGVDFLDKKIERSIDSMLVRIEPILSVGLGLIVGSILLGVYLPMFDYMGHIK